MIRRFAALVGTGALLLFGTGALAPSTAPAAAAPVSQCTSTKGTIMAVDYHHWGGPIVRGCDLRDFAHADKAHQGANTLFDDLGFLHTGTQHDGPYFICRIGNAAWKGGTQYPTPSAEACNLTPPASAYWSYWLAPAGQNHWSYSQLGAYSEVPKQGEVELWIFGGTDIKGSQGDPVNGFPTCTPNSLRAGGSPTSCTPTASHGTKSDKYTPSPSRRGRAHTSGHHATPPPPPHTPSLPASTSPSASASASTSTRPSSSAARSSTAPSSVAPSSSSSSTSAGAVAVDAKPASQVTTSSGSTVPLIVGLGLAAVLAAGGGFAVWRRRQSD